MVQTTMCIDYIETFPWWGAKSNIGEDIIKFYPKQVERCIDCCAGSGKLIINPLSNYPELIYNDADFMLCCLFEVIQDAGTFYDFAKRIYNAGYNSRDDFDKYRDMRDLYENTVKKSGFFLDENCLLKRFSKVDIAVAMFTLICQSFSAMKRHYREPDLFINKIYMNRLLHLHKVHERLNAINIRIIHGNAFDWIASARKNDFLILDVPYLAGKSEARKKIGAYESQDWPVELHRKFLDAIRHSEAKVLICGYWSGLYQTMLNPVEGIPTYQGQWGQILIKNVSRGSGKKLSQTRRVDEYIWINYPTSG